MKLLIDQEELYVSVIDQATVYMKDLKGTLLWTFKGVIYTEEHVFNEMMLKYEVLSVQNKNNLNIY